jgi:two-component system CheB/CheR fusion protein
MSRSANNPPPESKDTQTGDPGFLVVRIGASAGGISALRQFFSRVTPESGAAFVVILHLSPRHESNLAALLQTQTTLTVTQVNETVALQANHIYVNPPQVLEARRPLHQTRRA